MIATDGLTEARDPQRNFLEAGEIEGWISAAPDTTSAGARRKPRVEMRRWTRDRIADDLAILAVRPH